jgi:hypothetical protein
MAASPTPDHLLPTPSQTLRKNRFLPTLTDSQVPGFSDDAAEEEDEGGVVEPDDEKNQAPTFASTETELTRAKRRYQPKRRLATSKSTAVIPEASNAARQGSRRMLAYL